MKVVTVKLHEGASPLGYHHWKEMFVCPRRANLNTARVTKGMSRATTISTALQAGELFHGYMEVFFKKQGLGDASTIRFNRPTNPEALDIALRAYRAFRGKYKPDCFGKVLQVEETYVTENLTGRVDLLTKVSKAQAKKLSAEYGLAIESGFYVVDHKLIKSLHFTKSYPHDLQFQVYMQLTGARGVLVNCVTKDRPTQFKVLLVEPWPAGTRIVHEWLCAAQQLQKTNLPFLTSCFDHQNGELCPFRQSGECVI
jgi:hypothetical protein